LLQQRCLDILPSDTFAVKLLTGKANAPYKEVIVEEALVQLLESFNSEPTPLIEVLMSRQN
jgi:hypothetical protein